MPLLFREKHIEKNYRDSGKNSPDASDGSCPKGWAGSMALAWARRSNAKIYCISYEETKIVKLGINTFRAHAYLSTTRSMRS